MNGALADQVASRERRLLADMVDLGDGPQHEQQQHDRHRDEEHRASPEISQQHPAYDPSQAPVNAGIAAR